MVFTNLWDMLHLFTGISADYACPKFSLLLLYDARGIRTS